MGPRQKSLGNVIAIVVKITIRITSMGPRQKSLGNGITISISIRHCDNFNGAEAKKPRKLTSEFFNVFKDTLLQWGRGKKASEISIHDESQIMARANFNGAEAKKPRKCGSVSCSSP